MVLVLTPSPSVNEPKIRPTTNINNLDCNQLFGSSVTAIVGIPSITAICVIWYATKGQHKHHLALAKPPHIYMWEEYFLGLGRSLGPFIPCYKTDKFVNLQKITEAIANNDIYFFAARETMIAPDTWVQASPGIALCVLFPAKNWHTGIDQKASPTQIWGLPPNLEGGVCLYGLCLL